MITLTNGRNRALAVAGTAVLALGLLAGCAPSEPEIGPRTSADLQSSVLEVTRAAATGAIADAIAKLDTLQAKLREATAKGALTADRTMRIQAAIDLVRADLTAALPPPTPTPTPTVTVTETPTPQTPKPDNSNEGKGKNKKDGDSGD